MMRKKHLIGVVSALMCAPLALQAQGASVTVIGIVVDSLTGARVSAARVSLGLETRGVATNTLGQFSLGDVPVGMRRFIVSRLGYEDREVVVQVTDPMGGVQVKLMPEPLQLEGLSTKGAREGDLRGRVVDAETGEPVPFARVTLTRDGVKQVGKRMRFWSSDTLGYFQLPDIQVGLYFLKVERPGYTSRIESLTHQVPEPPVQIPLSHDYARGAALVEVMRQLDVRVSAATKAVVVSEDKLQSSTKPFMDQWLMFEGPLNWGTTPDVETKENPRPGQPPLATGRIVPSSPPPLYVDGYKQEYFNDPTSTLLMYSPKEFYRVDFIQCEGVGVWIFAYTYAYIEDRMMNPAKKDPQRDPTALC
jgi:hypothetical protein